MSKIIVVVVFFITRVVSAQTPQVEKVIELTGFNNPESIIKDDKYQVIYVSNVNGNPTDKDSNGYISKVAIDGTIISHKWIEGLHAPKGMALYNGKLFVADIDVIVEIDIAKGKIVATYKVEGATFLNDLAADNKGTIYASNTFGFSAIYKLNKEKNVTLFSKDDALQMPNGLLVEGDKLLVASWGIGLDPATYQTKVRGSLLSVSLVDKQIKKLAAPIGNLDGIVKAPQGYLLTDWLAGKLLYYKDAIATELVDLPQGSADLEFDHTNNCIYIPLMNDNKIVIYKLKK